jgi:hypothetical protein
MVGRTLFLFSVATLATLAGCYVDNGPRRGSTSSAPAPAPTLVGSSSSGGTSSGNTTTDPSAPVSVTPVVAVIDSNQTVSAVGGDGVGVFVEYVKGGEWHVFWTCDTNHSSRPCDFDLRVTVGTGKLSGAVLEGGLGQDAVSPVSGAEIAIRSSSTTEVHGLRMTSEPGAVLSIDARVDGLSDSAFFFFVQDGKVNGGYSGKLTNPLQFVGKTP